MLSLMAALTLAPTSLNGSIDQLNLSRTYKADETHAYVLHVEMEEMGVSIDTEVFFKVKKTSDGSAELSMAARNFSMKREGNDTGDTGPEEMLSSFDKHGLPQIMKTENESWVYVLAALSGFVPGREVEVGNGFDVRWAATDKSYTVNGKGKLIEVVDHEDAKAARMEYSLEITPSDDHTGYVKVRSLLETSTGRGISAEGTVEVENQRMKFTVKRLKA